MQLPNNAFYFINLSNVRMFSLIEREGTNNVFYLIYLVNCRKGYPLENANPKSTIIPFLYVNLPPFVAQFSFGMVLFFPIIVVLVTYFWVVIFVFCRNLFSYFVPICTVYISLSDFVVLPARNKLIKVVLFPNANIQHTPISREGCLSCTFPQTIELSWTRCKMLIRNLYFSLIHIFHLFQFSFKNC